MKSTTLVATCLALTLVSVQGQTTSAGNTSPSTPTVVPAPTAFHEVARDANSKTWQRETYESGPNGQVVTHVHQYKEVATGMHVLQNAQWTESQEIIEPSATGAIAKRGPYQVSFAGNLNTSGAISMQTADGKQFVSNILGLGYYDSSSGQAVLVAQIKDSQGELLSANQVIYRDAFDGVSADVQYTYKRSGFEQDVILRSQPPSANTFGLNPQTTKLEVFTEFLDAPQATVTVEADGQGNIVDENISWGTTQIGHGHAFEIPAQNDGGNTAVQKQYINVDGRKILIEMVPIKAIAAPLSTLPLQSSISKPQPIMAFARPAKRSLLNATNDLAFAQSSIIPGALKAKGTKKPMQLATITPPAKGYVLDYLELNQDQSDFTFQSDTTYYVSGPINLAGITTIEGGAIIKFDRGSTASLNVLGTLKCQTAQYFPAIFTSTDDNTVGENVGSSGDAACTGNLALHVQNDWFDDVDYLYIYDQNWNTIVYDENYPAISSGGCADYSFTAGLGQTYFFDAYDQYGEEAFAQFNPALNNGTVDIDLYGNPNYSETGSALCTPPQGGAALSLANGGSLHDLRFCNIGTAISSAASYSITNAQFVNCGTALQVQNGFLYAGNILMSGVGKGIYGQNFQSRVEQLTFDQGSLLTDDPAGTESGTGVTLVNSLLTGVGGYGVVPVTTDHVDSPTGSGIYQVVGAGSHYLANGSPYHNAGSANISPSLLAELSQRTTYPPIVNPANSGTAFVPQAPRDNSGVPDYGYHYDPLDYVFGGYDLAAPLTFGTGTAVGWYEDYGQTYLSGQPYGFALNDGAVLSFNGTANQPCYFAVNKLVQEGNGNWNSYGWMGSLILNGSGRAPVPEYTGQFTKIINLFCWGGERDNWAFGVGRLSNCEFYNGGFGSYGSSYYMTNCLFWRGTSGLISGAAAGSVTIQNCTFYNGGLFLQRSSGRNPSFWAIFNTTFDGTALLTQDGLNGNSGSTYMDHNAYNSGNNSWMNFNLGFGTRNTLEIVGPHDVQVSSGYNWQSSWLGCFYLPSNSPLLGQGNVTADRLGLYEFTTQTSQRENGISLADIGYHYLAVDGHGNPLSTLVNGVPDYISDANGNGLPDSWEFNWFGNYNHFASDKDISGNTLLSDFQNNVAPVDPYYDFMNVLACVPLPVNSYGFVPNQQPSLVWYDGGPNGTVDYAKWSVALDDDPHLTGKTFYRKVTTIYKKVSSTETYTSEIKQYYFNPATPEDPETLPTFDYSEDLRITGFPSDAEWVNTTTITGTPTTSPPVESQTWNLAYDQSGCPHPTFLSGTDGSETCIQHYEAEGSGSWFGWQPVTTTTIVSEPMTVNDVTAYAQELLASIPVTPGTTVSTREGPVNFNYFGMSAANVGSGNLIPADATYDINGNYTLGNLTPNQLYGIQCGTNEAQNPLSPSPDWTIGRVYPVMWSDGTTPAGNFGYSNPSGGTEIETISGTSISFQGFGTHGGVILPSEPFVTRTGSITIQGGRSGYAQWQPRKRYLKNDHITDSNGATEICVTGGIAGLSGPVWPNSFGTTVQDGEVTWKLVPTPVTAIVTGSHVNQLLVFPIQNGTIVTCETQPKIYPAYIGPATPRMGGMQDFPFAGIVAESSRLYIPKNPSYVDIAGFANLTFQLGVSFMPWFQTLLWNPYPAVTEINSPSGLSAGEYQVTPSMINGSGAIVLQNGSPIAGISLQNAFTQSGDVYVPLNNGDADHDGIPDFADGYNLFGTANLPCQSAKFMPISLGINALNPAKALVRFTYSESDPAQVKKTVNADGSFHFTRPTGGLRLWAADGDNYRNMSPIDNWTTDGDGNAVPNGDFIATGQGYVATNFNRGIYIEGLHDGDYTLLVELDPDGKSGFVLNDQLTVHVVSVDADADFANAFGFGGFTDTVDASYDQNLATTPGKIVGVNDGDTDFDGVPGYADGFSLDPTNPDETTSKNDKFVPMTIKLPSNVDVTFAKLRITYNASDPKQLIYSANPSKWTPASGNLRLWTKDGNQARNMDDVDNWLDVDANGNPLGNYIPGDSHVYDDITMLGFSSTTRTITNYIEGIAPSYSIGDQNVKVELDPLGDGHWISLDNYHVTVLAAQLDIARTDGSTVPHDQKFPNGSVVQITPAYNPSSLYANSLFLNLPKLDIQPESLSSTVTLTLQKSNAPAGNGNAALIRIYRMSAADADFKLFMDTNSMVQTVNPADLASASSSPTMWQIDATSGGVVDLALVATMQEGGTTVELCRSTVRISAIPCPPAVNSPSGYSRIVFVNPNSDSPQAPYDNFLHNAAHTIWDAICQMQADDNVLIVGGKDANPYYENSRMLTYGGVLAGLGGSWTMPDPSGYDGPNSDVFDFTTLPIINGNRQGVTMLWADGVTAGSEITFAGLVLSNGYAGSYGYSAGGAIYLADLPNSVPASIMCCDFENNLATNFGGGLYVSAVPNSSVSSSKFTKNQVLKQFAGVDFGKGKGGAIACMQSIMTVSDCRFFQNEAMVEDVNGGAPSAGSAAGGGDMYLTNANLTITRCYFKQAIAGYPIPQTTSQDPAAFTGDGGSILVHGSAASRSIIDITYSTFDSPRSYGNGGGIAMCCNSSPIDRALFTKDPRYTSVPDVSYPPDLDGTCVGNFGYVTFTNCQGGWQGGAVLANGRGMDLYFADCIFTKCTAGKTQQSDGKGGGMAVGGGLEGPIAPLDYIDVDDCTFTGCSASGNGGGLYTTINGNLIIGGNTVIQNCTANNYADGQIEGLGGAIHCSAGGVLTLSDNTLLKDNVAAAQGGGLSVKSSCATLNNNVTIQGNHAEGNAAGGWANGGGIYVTTCRYEGMGMAAIIFDSDGVLSCNSSSVSVKNNTANRWGGGLYAGVYAPDSSVVETAGTSIIFDSVSVASNYALSYASGSIPLCPSQIATENVGNGTTIYDLDFQDTQISGNPNSDIGIFQSYSYEITGIPNYVPGALKSNYLSLP